MKDGFTTAETEAPYYAVGTWIEAKNKSWLGIIIDLYKDDRINPCYIVGFLGQGVLYMTREQLDKEVQIILYPWKQYFKPGNAVALLTPFYAVMPCYKGTIVEVNDNENSTIPIHVLWETGGRSAHNPHELIKVGER